MSKNLQKVKDMLDGNFKHKIQSGYTPDTPHREIGEEWVNADGKVCVQRKGYVSIGTLANSDDVHF